LLTCINAYIFVNKATFRPGAETTWINRQTPVNKQLGAPRESVNRIAERVSKS